MHPNFVAMQERDGAAFAVLESITDAFFALGLDWEFTYINSQAEYVLGHAREDLLGRTIWSVYPALAGSEFEQRYRQAARDQRPCEFTAFYPDHQRWYEVHGYPAEIGISVYFRNVTEQIATQQALAEKINKLEEVDCKQAFELALVASLRDSTDTGTIVACASALLAEQIDAARVVFSEVDASGIDKLALQFGVEGWSTLQADAPLPAFDGACTVPLVQRGELQAIVVLHGGAARTWRPLDIALSRTMAALTWARIQNARAEVALKAERDQSQHIFKSLSEGFAIMDSNWVMVQINAAGLQIGQRTEGEVVGRTVWDVWPEIAGTDIEERYRKTMNTRMPDAFERPVRFSNGVRMWLELRLLPVLSGGMAVHYRDMSARREIEEQLRDADRRKDEFLAMLAHELRNPLAPISAAADLLSMGSADPARVRKTSEVISRQVKHLTSLVDDLLDVSRVTRGQVLLKKVVLDVRRVAIEAVEQVQPLLDSRNHQLAVDLPAQPAWVQGDHKRLVQILTNLLNNAAKYTPEGGRIALRMQAGEDEVKIVIADNGIGMASTLVAHAFDLFAQAERTSDRAQGGLGIGLALVRSLVELHQGAVSVFSKGVGEGSEFTVLLPYMAGAAPDALLASSLRL